MEPLTTLSLISSFFVTNVFADPSLWKNETVDWDNIDHLDCFHHWQSVFNKTYADFEEESYRFDLFIQNWKMINDFNIASNRSFTLRMNQFSDLTPDEFKVEVHGHTGSCLLPEATSSPMLSDIDPNIEYDRLLNKSIPDAIDWTDYKGDSYLSPVKNQGGCGACWAFSSTGAIESRYAIKYGKAGDITELSEQQLVDCSSNYGNAGCNGGVMNQAFKYVKASGGLCSEKAYPYKGKVTSCKSTTCGTKYYPLSESQSVRGESESLLRSAVAEGPVSVAVEADQSSFMFYGGGILDGLCGVKVDHGVLVVGYGSLHEDEFWKIKNSWGSHWGEDGYLRICRNCHKNGKYGECGVLRSPSYPIIK